MQSDIFSISFLKKFLKEKGIFLSRTRGQNFLVDKNISFKIVQSIPEGSVVFEVGPGLGALTFQILKRAEKVYAVEFDKKIFNILKEFTKDDNNIILFNEDFLKFDMEKIKEKELFFVSNLPYSISGEAIKKFIEEEKFNSGIVMLQKEFVERLLAPPGEKNYGLLSIISYFFLDIDVLFSVSKNCFFPVPEVDSIVVKLKKKNFCYPQDKFATFIKKAFSKRRKTIYNNLKEFGFSEEEILQFEIKINQRPEEIYPDKWLTLFEYYLSHKFQE